MSSARPPPAPADPGLPLVAGDGPRLALDATCDCFLEFHLGQPWHSQEGVLRHLPEPAAVLARRQAGEHLGVADHGHRLPERSHQVFPLGQIDTGLPTDRGVHLGEQRRRDVSDRYAPVVDGGRKPGHIGHHSPTHTHDDVCSCQAELGKAAAELLDGAHGLGFFALVDEERTLLHASVDLDAHARLRDDRGSRGAARYHRREACAGHQGPRAPGKTFLPGLPSALSQHLQR